MTQQNPGQPYIPPSASSGSGVYNPQQYQAQTSQYQAGGATSAASAQIAKIYLKQAEEVMEAVKTTNNNN